MEVAAFPKYDEYQDSGVPWIGEIPSHWSVMRNLGIFEERKSVNRPDMELLAVTISKGVIRQSEITTKKDSSNENKSKYKVVYKGDLAYNKMRMWQGAIGESMYDGIVSPAYVILNTKNKKYSRYYHYLYRTKRFIHEANRNSYGLCDDMNSLRYEDFKTIYSPTPPEQDVARIVDFLDEKTAEIDTTIAKKQQLIQLLNEQKTILINRAVTKGLNPDVKMQDSGVPWIGKIPEHWEIGKLKYKLDLLPGFAFKSNVYSNNPNDIKLLRGVNITPGTTRWSDNVYWPQDQDFSQVYFLKKGDLVFGMDRPWIKSGIRVARIANDDLPCLLLQRVARLRSRAGLRQGYLELLLRSKSFEGYFSPMLTGISVPHISPDQIKNFVTGFPDECEQQEIEVFCEQASFQIAELINKENDAIKALKEFRQILITSATTGKIKV